MRLLIMCSSKKPVNLNSHGYDFYNFSGEWKKFPRDRSQERVEYLAMIRNTMTEEGLRKFPDTTHILNVDEDFINQWEAMEKIIKMYPQYEGLILGGAIFFLDKWCYPARWKFWDTWATPEGQFATLNMTGTIKVRALSGVFLYPRKVADRARYGIPSNFPNGCDVTKFCDDAEVPVYMTYDVKLIHPCQDYSPYQRLFHTIHKIVINMKKQVVPH